MAGDGVRVGCSGWQYADWRGVLYPPGLAQRDWLDVYARHFDVVEVNATFYRLPNRDAVARWAAQTPPGFVFVIKVSRYLTHIRRLTEITDGMARLFERIEPLAEAGKLGALLWQLPPNMRCDLDRLADALAEFPPWPNALEFRERSWFRDDVYELLRAHDVACVLADDKRRPLPVPPPTASFEFVRFHYGTRGRGGNYSATEIEEWARWLEGRRGFAFFNNDWQGFAPRNAQALLRALGRGR